MARQAPYKQYTRNQRKAVLDTDFSKGMMATNGLVAEGYVKTLTNFTFEKDNGSLVPRPALRPYQLIMPDMDFDIEDAPFLLENGLSIKDVKECVEDGKTYYQIVLGLLEEGSDDSGPLIFVTTDRPNEFSLFKLNDEYTYDVRYTSSVYSEPITANFYSSELPVIHGVSLSADPSKSVEFPVGTFAFGNSYYFFGDDGLHQGLFRTVFDAEALPPRYKPEYVRPKELSVSESVAYGYNMLLKDRAYSFTNKLGSGSFQFEGILPYLIETNALGEHLHSKLLMRPRANQLIDLVCYYSAPSNAIYEIVWESRETTSSDWTELKRETVTFDVDTELTLDGFNPQNKDLMIRVSAYTTGSDRIEKAMVVGFDFSGSTQGAASFLDQKVYDLSTATGMESWNGRIVLWGLSADPTILFISDYNEPAYFPYPNNITVFDEPIIYAVEFMDSLVVFTTNKIYQVTNEDGTFKSTVLQSHLSINTWDKHLIQTVRNMLYFKSGNYYYMMVPKAQSLTGELTLAPITTPITSFFDNFSVSVDTILRETYDYTGDYNLITYYNFLDYEDVHNIYLYQFEGSSSLMHFDVIYNTVDRTWKVWVYESAHMLYPFRQNATETGLLGMTSLITAVNKAAPLLDDIRRIIQVLTWDKLGVRESYLPNGVSIIYDTEHTGVTIDQRRLIIPSSIAHIDENGVLVFQDEYADIVESRAVLYGLKDYYSGYYVNDIFNALKDVFVNNDKYFTFRNYQFLDTGYRDDEVQAKKRYRELQLQINNLDKKDMNFGMEFILDGAYRKIYYKYDTNQTIDEFDPEYGIVYVDSTPYLETDLKDIDITNQWTIDQSLTPDISLWKVRIAISGKGSAPRFKLFSRNEKRFELLGISWISRLMHMR